MALALALERTGKSASFRIQGFGGFGISGLGFGRVDRGVTETASGAEEARGPGAQSRRREAAMARHIGGGHQRHAQAPAPAPGQGDEEDPHSDGSPAMKDRRRRRRHALLDVVPLLRDLDTVQRSISRERQHRAKLALLFLAALLFVALRYFSRSGGGGLESAVSKTVKVEKPSNLNRLDMPMRSVRGVRQRTNPTAWFCFWFVKNSRDFEILGDAFKSCGLEGICSN